MEKLQVSSPSPNFRERHGYKSDQWKDRKDYSNTGGGGGGRIKILGRGKKIRKFFGGCG